MARETATSSTATSRLASSLPALPPKRAHHALVYDEHAKQEVLIGGSTPVNGGQSFDFFNELWAFDGAGWKSLGTSGSPRSGVSIAYDSKRNRIMSFGG